MPGHESIPVLMLTGLDDDASITRAYEAGATDFFVKSTQWSLLAGRLRYLLRSARTRIELERSKAKLARAQDLARMGSFDWHRGASDLGMSVEGLRVFGLGANDRVGLRQIRTAIDAYKPSAEETAAWERERDTFIDRTLSVLTRPGKRLEGASIPQKADTAPLRKV